MKQIFIAWTPFIRRPESMRKHFGFALLFLPPPFEIKSLKLLGYMVNSYKMFNLLVRLKPDVLWIQLAPAFLLYIAVFYKKFINKHVFIVADCHNSMFYPIWMRFPLVIRFLNKCDVVLVHNEKVKEKALTKGVFEQTMFVLETRPALIDCSSILQSGEKLSFPNPWILMPCSFDQDEPVDKVFDAARLMPEITLAISGKTSRAAGIHDLSQVPENVVLTGFLSNELFDQYFCQADIIMGLTTEDDIQLSVANEAVGAGKVMVISDTLLLRNLFKKGAVYVETHDPKSIAAGCRTALEDSHTLTKEVQDLRQERIARWIDQADDVVARIQNSVDVE